MHIVSKTSSLNLLIAALGATPMQQTLGDTETHQEGDTRDSSSDMSFTKLAELHKADSWKDFWPSVYRMSRPLPEARTLLPPIAMFEFCKGATMAPKEKSFVFACLLCTAPLLIPELVGHENIANLRMIPPELPLLSEAQLRNMAAWHLVDLLEMGIVQEVDSAPLEVLTSGDRMQYLQESKTFKSVPMLEEARWQSLDVATDANTLSLTEQKTELLTDMVMLLNLLGVSSDSNKSAATLAPALIATTMLLWSVPLTAETEHRVSYFLAQHYFQSVRCILLGKRLVDNDSTSVVAVLTWNQRPLLEGWRAYQKHLLGFVVDDPPHADPLLFSHDRLASAGLWPLMINPYRLLNQNWDELQHMEPYKHYSLMVPLLERAVTPQTRAPIDGLGDNVAHLVDHVSDAFSRLPPAPVTRRGVIRSTTTKESCRDRDPNSTLNWALSHSPLSKFVEEHPEWEDAASFGMAFREAVAVGLCAGCDEKKGPVVAWPLVPEPLLIPAVLGPCATFCFCREGQADHHTQLRTILRLHLWVRESPNCDVNVGNYISETLSSLKRGVVKDPVSVPSLPLEMPTDNFGQGFQNSRLSAIRGRLLRKLQASRNDVPRPKPPKLEEGQAMCRAKKQKRKPNYSPVTSEQASNLSKTSTDLSEHSTDLSEPSMDVSEPSMDVSKPPMAVSEPRELRVAKPRAMLPAPTNSQWLRGAKSKYRATQISSHRDIPVGFICCVSMRNATL